MSLGSFLRKVWELKKQCSEYIDYEKIEEIKLPVKRKRGRPKKNKDA